MCHFCHVQSGPTVKNSNPKHLPPQPSSLALLPWSHFAVAGLHLHLLLHTPFFVLLFLCLMPSFFFFPLFALYPAFSSPQSSHHIFPPHLLPNQCAWPVSAALNTCRNAVNTFFKACLLPCVQSQAQHVQTLLLTNAERWGVYFRTAVHFSDLLLLCGQKAASCLLLYHPEHYGWHTRIECVRFSLTWWILHW